MSNKGKEEKFINEWNEVLDYKIDEKSLRNPNFGFIFGALESILRHLNFDLNAIKEMSSDNERIYYIKFCSIVNRLYQLSDDSFRFYYCDFLKPSKSNLSNDYLYVFKSIE